MRAFYVFIINHNVIFIQKNEFIWLIGEKLHLYHHPLIYQILQDAQYGWGKLFQVGSPGSSPEAPGRWRVQMHGSPL